ncbi:MAG: L,D-transpeptidase family protein [Woeseiaceae bacterium]
MLKRILIFLSASLLFSVAYAENIRLAKLSNLDVAPLNAAVKNELKSVLNILEERLSSYPKDYDAELLKAILYFKEGDVDLSLATLDKLIEKVPDFQLAHLLKGDLLLSKFSAASGLGETTLLSSLLPKLNKNKQGQLQLLREEAQVRMRTFLGTKTRKKWPRQILGLGKSVKKALLIDKTANRLYVFTRKDSGELFEEVNNYYITTGKLVGNKNVKGDLRTPEGVYFVTSWISPNKLPSKYGVGAFPVNYPNELDKHNGKTGYGIWLHGTDDGFYSRPPRDSEGCIVLTNIDLNTLKSDIKPGLTPVIITENIEWVDYSTWIYERKQLIQAVESWRLDWESMNVNKYLAHYEKSFWSATHNYKSWSARKRLLAKNKKYQSVKLSDISYLLYPEDKKNNKQIAVVRLHQDYKSNNFKGSMYKRLYLSKKNNQWKIIYEGK